MIPKGKIVGATIIVVKLSVIPNAIPHFFNFRISKPAINLDVPYITLSIAQNSDCSWRLAGIKPEGIKSIIIAIISIMPWIIKRIEPIFTTNFLFIPISSILDNLMRIGISKILNLILNKKNSIE